MTWLAVLVRIVLRPEDAPADSHDFRSVDTWISVAMSLAAGFLETVHVTPAGVMTGFGSWKWDGF